MSGVRRGEDLPEQEGRPGAEEAERRAEEASPDHAGAHRQQEGRLRTPAHR